MTPRDWLSTREPAPPERLTARLAELLVEHGVEQVTPDALVRTSGAVLTHLVRDNETARNSALELLAADALATYAFETQADDPDSLDAACARAMRFLSGFGADA